MKLQLLVGILVISLFLIPNAYAYIKNDYLTKIETYADITSAYTHYKICNPTYIDYYINSPAKFNVEFDEVKNKLTAYKFTKLTNVSYNVSIGEYGICNKTKYDLFPHYYGNNESWETTLKENGTEEYSCVTGSHPEMRYKLEWVEFKPLGETFKANTCYDIRIEGSYPAVLGGTAIDNIISYAGYNFDELDWWNSNWTKRYRLWANTTNNTNYIHFPVEWNISGTDCMNDVNDIRLIDNETGTSYELKYDLFDDVLHSQVNITTYGQPKNKVFWLYCNSTTAAKPSYSGLRYDYRAGNDKGAAGQSWVNLSDSNSLNIAANRNNTEWDGLVMGDVYIGGQSLITEDYVYQGRWFQATLEGKNIFTFAAVPNEYTHLSGNANMPLGVNVKRTGNLTNQIFYSTFASIMGQDTANVTRSIYDLMRCVKLEMVLANNLNYNAYTTFMLDPEYDSHVTLTSIGYNANEAINLTDKKFISVFGGKETATNFTLYVSTNYSANNNWERAGFSQTASVVTIHFAENGGVGLLDTGSNNITDYWSCHIQSGGKNITELSWNYTKAILNPPKTSISLTAETEKKYPYGIEEDTGNDGSVDYSFVNELNEGNSPQMVDLNITAVMNYLTICPFSIFGLCNVPLNFSVAGESQVVYISLPEGANVTKAELNILGFGT